jgi:outer membrane protein OmpA-like peptidoglycan-associated protein
MKDQDSAKRPALILLTCIVALVVAGVVGWGVAKAFRHPRPPAEVTQSSELTGAATFQVVFSAGAEKLPLEALKALGAAADQAREGSNTSLVISAFHDSSQTADLARSRAAAVQHALESLGIQSNLIQIAPVQDVTKVSEKNANLVNITVE